MKNFRFSYDLYLLQKRGYDTVDSTVIGVGYFESEDKNVEPIHILKSLQKKYSNSIYSEIVQHPADPLGLLLREKYYVLKIGGEKYLAINNIRKL